MALNFPAEAEIIVNGNKLTDAESMCVRVALTSFHSEMHDPDALGTDEIGRSITQGYRRNSETALCKIITRMS